MITQSMKRAFSSVSKRFPGSVTLYRTKSALDFKPIAASRESFTTKDGLEATQVSRQGTLLLRFAPANQGSEGSGKFAWNDSIMIGLTPLELGSLLIDIPEGKGLTFYRDTNMSGKLRGDSTGGDNNSMGSGVKKWFSVSHTEQRNGYWFNMEEENHGQNKKVSLVVSHAEMAFLKVLTSAILPNLVGWDQLGSSVSSSSDNQSRSSENSSSSPFVSERKNFFDPQ